MISERYLNFLSEISGKFPIGNFGKLPRPIPTHNTWVGHIGKDVGVTISAAWTRAMDLMAVGAWRNNL